jgi:hypothetical protein
MLLEARVGCLPLFKLSAVRTSRVAGYTQYAVHSDVVICGRGTETVNAEALMVPVVMLLEAVVGCLSLFKLSRAVRTFE